MEMMAAEALVEDLGELQAAGQAEDQGDVIDPFMIQVQGVPHRASGARGKIPLLVAPCERRRKEAG
jgi:hypothetical protein